MHPPKFRNKVQQFIVRNPNDNRVGATDTMQNRLVAKLRIEGRNWIANATIAAKPIKTIVNGTKSGTVYPNITGVE